MTFGAHKLVRFKPFWTTYAKFDNCCQHNMATYGKKFIQVHICILGPKLLQWNFIQMSHLSIRNGHTSFR